MLVVRIEGVDFLSEICFDSVLLPERFFIVVDLLLKRGGVDLQIDLFLHQRCEAGLADQLDDDLSNSAVQQIAGDLLFVITLVAPVHTELQLVVGKGDEITQEEFDEYKTVALYCYQARLDQIEKLISSGAVSGADKERLEEMWLDLYSGLLYIKSETLGVIN